MMKATPKFAIVCMQCRPKKMIDKHLIANGEMTLTIEGDIIFECHACGCMERYVVRK